VTDSSTITIKSGATRILAFTLYEVGTTTPVDISVANDIVLVVTNANNRCVLQKWLKAAANGVELIAGGHTGLFNITLNAESTSPAFGVGSVTDINEYTYEIRIYLPEQQGADLQDVILGGTITINPTTSWGTENAEIVEETTIVHGVF